MEVNFKTVSGKSTTLKVQNNESIKMIKAKLEVLVGESGEKIGLAYLGKHMENNSLIEDYNIKEKDFIVAYKVKGKSFEIFVSNSLVKKSESFIVGNLDTIYDLKKKVAAKWGYSMDDVDLIYKDKFLLIEDISLQDCNITDKTTINLRLDSLLRGMNENNNLKNWV